MITNNPFFQIAELIPPLFMQIFVVVMIILVVVGTLLDMIHKKNVKYFFENVKKAKNSATKILNTGEKTSIVVKTITSDVFTTSELDGQRRLAHLLGMYGTIIFWVVSVIMIFCYSSPTSLTPFIFPLLWHLGAIMTVVGGCWFWFFLRVDVAAEAYPWYRIIHADLFVLSLVITSFFGLIWSYLQATEVQGWNILFLVFFILSNLILFGGVYWSKFAHMFYKPGAALQKNFSEADGSRDNLPAPSDKPKQFGKGINREAPKHY